MQLFFIVDWQLQAIYIDLFSILKIKTNNETQ